MLICPECNALIKIEKRHCNECGCPMEYILQSQTVNKVNYSASTDIKELELASNDGNSEAQYWLAYCYYYGLNGVDDESVAKSLLIKAKKTGHTQAEIDYVTWFGADEPLINEPININYPLKTLFERYDAIIVFDVETSGLDFKNDNIIELAAIKLKQKSGKIVVESELDYMIKLPFGVKLSPKIVEITNITDDILARGGKSKEIVCIEFAKMIGNEKILFIAYNAQFDISFIYSFLSSFDKEYLLEDADVIDALTVYKDRRQYPHKLGDAIVAYELEEVVKNSHKAIDDVYSLFEVVKAMNEEKSDLTNYINLFGYNPKWGINGKQISGIKYVAQYYNSTWKLYEV